jgi:hypothetical protein
MEKRIFENFAEIKIQEDEQEIMIVYITKDTFTKQQGIVFENLGKEDDISGILKKMDIFPQRITVQGKDISKILNLNFIKEYLTDCKNPFMEVEFVRANAPKIGIIIKKSNIQVIAKSMIFDVDKGTVLPMTSIKAMYEDLEEITQILKELKNTGIWKLITGKDE